MNSRTWKQMAVVLFAMLGTAANFIFQGWTAFLIGLVLFMICYALFDAWFEEKKENKNKDE